jgi:peptide/nickel transport system ATP-binding protein
MAPLLEVTGLSVDVSTGGHRRRIVSDVSLAIEPGEVLGVVGESGSGKTLTALSLVQLLPPVATIASGSVRFRGAELVGLSDQRLDEIRGRQVTMIFQDPMTSLNPIMRIGTQIEEPLRLHRLARGRAAHQAGVDMLQRVGIADAAHRIHRYPHEFSGGMRQRAMIASALITGPDLIIADEPTTALDVTVQAQILQLLRRLNREKHAAVLLISHDLGVIAELAHRVVVMYAGRVVEVGSAAAVLRRPRHPYTQALIAALPPPVAAGRTRRLQAIGGEAPDFAALPPGCPFHVRCSYAESKCAESHPPLAVDASGRMVACWRADQLELTGIDTTSGPTPVSERVQSGAVAEAPTAGEDDRPPLLEVTDLACSFRGGRRRVWFRSARIRAVDGVSFSIARGEVLGLAGESGSGKSTLARSILQLIRPDQGRVALQGVDLAHLRGRRLRAARKDMQPIFQDPYASLNPRARVEEIVDEPLAAHGIRGPAARARILEALALVGLGPSFARRFPHELSGGQRQRVGIARAIVLRPQLIVADEPISALDVSIQAQIINLLVDLRDQLGLSMLFISHDLRVVRYISSRVAIMYQGQIVELGAVDEVCGTPRHPYTAALLAAIPRLQGPPLDAPLGTGDGALESVEGGCPYRQRCVRAQETCAAITPTLDAVAAGHWVACHYPLTGRSSGPLERGEHHPTAPPTAVPEPGFNR